MAANDANNPNASPAGDRPREDYRFAEGARQRSARSRCSRRPRSPPTCRRPTRSTRASEQLKVAVEGQMARNAIAPMMYAPPHATRWFRFAVRALFEQVLARKRTLE